PLLRLQSVARPLSAVTRPSPPPPHALSLHDALPILHRSGRGDDPVSPGRGEGGATPRGVAPGGSRDDRDHGRRLDAQQQDRRDQDRKSTRLNSSHEWSSYAVFCLKKKNEKH